MGSRGLEALRCMHECQWGPMDSRNGANVALASLFLKGELPYNLARTSDRELRDSLVQFCSWLGHPESTRWWAPCALGLMDAPQHDN